ncbi:MAG TPA: hypothetical protein PKM88_00805 [bacterium]|nr:hypothetical protein [bacterium]
MSAPDAVPSAAHHAAAADLITRSRAPWLAALAALLALALLPLLWIRCPLAEDYGRILGQLHILSHYDDPAFDYPRHFVLRPAGGAYALFIAGSARLCRLLPVTVVGKALITVYFLLLGTVIAWRARRVAHAPWALLLLIPLAFNPRFYSGGLNYLLSMPLLVLALAAQDGPRSRRTALVQAACFLTLFFLHPFTCLIGLGLSACRWFFCRRPHWFCRPAWLLVPTAVLLFAGVARPLRDALWPLAPMNWMPPQDIFAYCLLPFTGMRLHNGIDLPVVLLWAAVAVLLDRAVRRHGLRLGTFGFLGAVLLVPICLLPVSYPPYGVINVRLAPLACFIIGLELCWLHFTRREALLLLCAVGMLVGLAGRKNLALSHEQEEILPLFARMPVNCEFLPLVFARRSPLLDSVFCEPRIALPDYYYSVRGGGYQPYPSLNAFHALAVRPEAALPAPPLTRPWEFSWERHGPHYRYYLLCGAPAEFLAGMRRQADPVAVSGSWALWQRREPAGGAAGDTHSR